MEGLTLREPRGASRRRSPTQLRRYSHRLPTPEASRSSHDALEALDDTDEARTSRPFGNLLHPMPGTTATSRSSPAKELFHRSSIRYPSAPHSPPYRDAEPQRPSLPPLRTLLRDDVSSPPQTPTTFSTSFTPFPQEPAYTTATYKPPALYPHKKQKTEGVAEPLTQGFVGSLTSPDTTAPSTEPTGLILGSVRRPSAPAFDGLRAERRMSIQYPQDAQSDSRDCERILPALDQHRLPRSATIDLRSRGPGMHVYQTPGSTSTSTIFDRDIPMSKATYLATDPSNPQRQHPRSELNRGHYTTRRPPTDQCNDFRDIQIASRHGRHSYPRVERAQALGDDYASRFGRAHFSRTAPPLAQSPVTYHQSPFDPSHASFFMPSQDENDHGKARKRSNLPKQSTEIMKHWFDQNITNPYPSEEQKAVFSQATGISITQVSNWFINHRRRCPELRDRREKHRGNSREFDL